MKQNRIKKYIEVVEEISKAIDNSNGDMKEIAQLANISLATVYRYLLVEGKLKERLYRAKIRSYQKLIKENKELIRRNMLEFYLTEDVLKFTREKN